MIECKYYQYLLNSRPICLQGVNFYYYETYVSFLDLIARYLLIVTKKNMYMFMSSYCSDQLENFKSSFGHGAYLLFITCVIQFVALSLSLSQSCNVRSCSNICKQRNRIKLKAENCTMRTSYAVKLVRASGLAFSASRSGWLVRQFFSLSLKT